MAPHNWDRRLLAAGYSPYAAWARQSVDALWWLVDIDAAMFSGDRANLGGHDPDTVDIAHVRWATGTAKTAIDLCAADIAVGYEVTAFWTADGRREHDRLERQSMPEHLHKNHRARLSEATRHWLSALVTDADYLALKSARDALTHRMTVRTALIRTRRPTGHQDRTLFDLQTPALQGRPDARALILFARDVATQHVEGFCLAAMASLPRTKDPAIRARIARLREVDGLGWSEISERTGIPQPTLAAIRKAAVADGRAFKGANGRVTWLPPFGE